MEEGIEETEGMFFFQGHNLYLMNAQGITMRKLYDSKTWRTYGDKL
jgi:hypothetical protein